LRSEFELHQGVEPRVLPFRPQRYRQAAPGATPAPQIEVRRQYDARDWIVLRRVGGTPLSLTRTVDVAIAVRGALLRHAVEPAEEVLSGHAADGQPTRVPHLIIQPLPNVGHRHADGRIMGVALVLPRTANANARAALLRALGHWEQLARVEKGQEDDAAPTLTLGVGARTEIEVERHVWGEPGAAALRPSTWCEASPEWLSVTPVALDRNPGELGDRDPVKSALAHRTAGEIIARACENVGLPLPQSVEILPSGTWPGGAKADQFPPFPQEPGKLRRVKVHARIRFSHAVAGPVILGAGRFVGLGIFRPVREHAA
jgi:CRISPR-associated protein Csb2